MNSAYAAGLFDGEGYVRIAKWEKPNSIHIRYQVVAGIGMTYLPVIQQLKDQYGGSINQNRHDLRNQNARIQFTWHIASQTAAAFFRQIFPYLIVKRDEVELALQMQDDIDKYRHMFKKHLKDDPIRNEIRARRQEIADQMFALKKRAYPPLNDSDPRTT